MSQLFLNYTATSKCSRIYLQDNSNATHEVSLQNLYMCAMDASVDNVLSLSTIRPRLETSFMLILDRVRVTTLHLRYQHAILWSTPYSCPMRTPLKILPPQPCSINHKRKVNSRHSQYIRSYRACIGSFTCNSLDFPLKEMCMHNTCDCIYCAQRYT